MLTDEEKRWIQKVQRVLNECPGRFGFYTIGDDALHMYDRKKENKILSEEKMDFCQSVAKHDANLGVLEFTSAVHATAG